MKRKKRTRSQPVKCYMCDKDATGREHVPPKSFFPSGRQELVTVASCTTHNYGNHQDVEYARNVIVTEHSTNELARTLSDKAIRSLRRSPGLRRSTLRDTTPVILNGRPSAAFILDIPRFNKVVAAIASAIYFKEYGKPYPNTWYVHHASLFSRELELRGLRDPGAEEHRAMLRDVFWVMKHTSHPDVFSYGTIFDSEHIAYKFVFYEGFTVFTIGLNPPDAPATSHDGTAEPVQTVEQEI